MLEPTTSTTSTASTASTAPTVDLGEPIDESPTVTSKSTWFKIEPQIQPALTQQKPLLDSQLHTTAPHSSIASSSRVHTPTDSESPSPCTDPEDLQTTDDADPDWLFAKQIQQEYDDLILAVEIQEKIEKSFTDADRQKSRQAKRDLKLIKCKIRDREDCVPWNLVTDQRKTYWAKFRKRVEEVKTLRGVLTLMMDLAAKVRWGEMKSAVLEQGDEYGHEGERRSWSEKIEAWIQDGHGRWVEDCKRAQRDFNKDLIDPNGDSIDAVALFQRLDAILPSEERLRSFIPESDHRTSAILNPANQRETIPIIDEISREDGSLRNRQNINRDNIHELFRITEIDKYPRWNYDEENGQEMNNASRRTLNESNDHKRKQPTDISDTFVHSGKSSKCGKRSDQSPSLLDSNRDLDKFPEQNTTNLSDEDQSMRSDRTCPQTSKPDQENATDSKNEVCTNHRSANSEENACSDSMKEEPSQHVDQTNPVNAIHTRASDQNEVINNPSFATSPNTLDGASVRVVRPSESSTRKGTFEEYIPNWHELIDSDKLLQGWNLYQEEVPLLENRKLVLTSAVVPDQLVVGIREVVQYLVKRYEDGSLAENKDGRIRAGPLDVPAFLENPTVQRLVHRAAIEKSKKRQSDMACEGECECEPLRCKAPSVLERASVLCIHPSGRKVLVGDPDAEMRNGRQRWEQPKEYQSRPIPQWTGGWKLDQTLGRPRVIEGYLSREVLNTTQKNMITKYANELWMKLCQHADAKEAVSQQLEYINKIRGRFGCSHQKTQLGHTGWNAFAVNIDFRTAVHLDTNNVPGSFSALSVIQMGSGYNGCLYMLPQFQMALDVKQGVVIYHRSADKDVGLHGNSQIRLNDQSAHRVSMVFYLTKLS